MNFGVSSGYLVQIAFWWLFLVFVEPGPLVQLGCGTISGALGATCVYPLQVIRTRYVYNVYKSLFSCNLGSSTSSYIGFGTCIHIFVILAYCWGLFSFVFPECKLNIVPLRECPMYFGEPFRMKVIEVSTKDSFLIFSRLSQLQALHIWFMRLWKRV